MQVLLKVQRLKETLRGRVQIEREDRNKPP